MEAVKYLDAYPRDRRHRCGPYRVTVYRQVVDHDLSALASLSADIEDHVREFEEACKRPAPTRAVPTKREQRRLWREDAFRRARCR